MALWKPKRWKPRIKIVEIGKFEASLYAPLGARDGNGAEIDAGAGARWVEPADRGRDLFVGRHVTRFSVDTIAVEGLIPVPKGPNLALSTISSSGHMVVLRQASTG
jgi:hypothetical protein